MPTCLTAAPRRPGSVIHTRMGLSQKAGALSESDERQVGWSRDDALSGFVRISALGMAHTRTRRSLTRDLDTESALPGRFVYPSGAGGSAAELCGAINDAVALSDCDKAGLLSAVCATASGWDGNENDSTIGPGLGPRCG